MNETRAEGNTVLWDALTAAVRAVARALPGVTPLRRRVLVLTDGVDSGSSASASGVVRAALATGVTIDSIQIGAEAINDGGLLHTAYEYGFAVMALAALALFGLLSGTHRTAEVAALAE